MCAVELHCVCGSDALCVQQTCGFVRQKCMRVCDRDVCICGRNVSASVRVRGRDLCACAAKILCAAEMFMCAA